MCLLRLYVELPFGNMERAWYVCDFREPWSWVLGQRVERQSIDTNHSNLCYQYGALEELYWNVILEKRREKEQQEPRTTE